MTARKLRTILSVGIMSAMALAAVAIASTARVHAAPQSIEDRVAKDQSQASPVKIYPKAVVDGQFENNKLILSPATMGSFSSRPAVASRMAKPSFMRTKRTFSMW